MTSKTTINRRELIATAAASAALLSTPALAQSATEIELFFPVPVDGALAKNMATLIKEFNDGHPGIKVTPVYTGSYDETLIKTRAAIKAGRPPAAAIMSANFLFELKLESEIQTLDDLIKTDGKQPQQFMGQFFPALTPNAVINREVCGVPFHNSTPILYINAEHFKEAGLDPQNPPRTWDELVVAARALTKREGDRVSRWGIMLPSSYDTCGWLLSALTMSNGGKYFNEEWGGEVYYDTASTLGAVQFWSDLVAKHKVQPAGELKAAAVTTAFLAGQSSMMLNSTGSLTFVRSTAKFPVWVGFVPKNVRNAAPIGGASLVIPAGVEGDRRKAAWTLINWLTSPEKSGWWSRSTGYFAPNMGAYDTPEMKEFVAQHPDAKIAIDQLAYAKPWFATYKTVPVRKAIEDELQAVLSGKKQPKEAVAAAQKAADELMRPFIEQTAGKLPAVAG